MCHVLHVMTSTDSLSEPSLTEVEDLERFEKERVKWAKRRFEYNTGSTIEYGADDEDGDGDDDDGGGWRKFWNMCCCKKNSVK